MLDSFRGVSRAVMRPYLYLIWSC